MRDPDWLYRAACRGTARPDDWFAGPHSLEARRALTVCLHCPVIAKCLADAMAAEASKPGCDRWGIAGARTAAQRIALAKGSVHGTRAASRRCRCEACRHFRVTQDLYWTITHAQEAAPWPAS